MRDCGCSDLSSLEEEPWSPTISTDSSEECSSESLLFQYFESNVPAFRVPLYENIKNLSKGFPAIQKLCSNNLSHSSWMSVAWYASTFLHANACNSSTLNLVWGHSIDIKLRMHYIEKLYHVEVLGIFPWGYEWVLSHFHLCFLTVLNIMSFCWWGSRYCGAGQGGCQPLPSAPHHS